MRKVFFRFGRDRRGATAIEYAMMAAFIGLGIITVLIAIGGELQGVFSDVEAGLKKRPA